VGARSSSNKNRCLIKTTKATPAVLRTYYNQTKNAGALKTLRIICTTERRKTYKNTSIKLNKHMNTTANSHIYSLRKVRNVCEKVMVTLQTEDKNASKLKHKSN
jgi:hypothetical protein